MRQSSLIYAGLIIFMILNIFLTVSLAVVQRLSFVNSISRQLFWAAREPFKMSKKDRFLLFALKPFVILAVMRHILLSVAGYFILKAFHILSGRSVHEKPNVLVLGGAEFSGLTEER